MNENHSIILYRNMLLVCCLLIITLLSSCDTSQDTSQSNDNDSEIIAKSVRYVFKKGDSYPSMVIGRMNFALDGSGMTPVEPTVWIFKDVPSYPIYTKSVKQGGAYYKHGDKWTFIKFVDA